MEAASDGGRTGAATRVEPRAGPAALEGAFIDTDMGADADADTDEAAATEAEAG